MHHNEKIYEQTLHEVPISTVFANYSIDGSTGNFTGHKPKWSKHSLVRYNTLLTVLVTDGTPQKQTKKNVENMNSLTIWSYEPGWEFYITCVVSSATRHGYWTGQNKNQKLCMHVLIIPDPLSSVEFSWPWFDPSSFSLLNRVGHVSSKYLVPHHKKGLWKVVLVSIELMVNVMICTVVAEQCLEDVPRKPQPAMIIHRLNGSKGEKEYGCPWSHTGDEKW